MLTYSPSSSSLKLRNHKVIPSTRIRPVWLVISRPVFESYQEMLYGTVVKLKTSEDTRVLFNIATSPGTEKTLSNWRLKLVQFSVTHTHQWRVGSSFIHPVSADGAPNKHVDVRFFCFFFQQDEHIYSCSTSHHNKLSVRYQTLK